MCNFVCSVITAVVGCILVIITCLISFLLVPNLVESIIKNEVLLIDDTVQYDRFETIPFALRFGVTVMEISNPEQVLTGEVPIMREVGPYVYRLYTSRNITYAEGDIMRYTRLENFEFDAEASFPLTEDDMVTIINVPYHAIIQIAQLRFPALVSVLNLALSSVFGVYNSPVTTFRVRELFFDGVRICQNPGLIGAVACNLIREIGASAQNLEAQDDGSLTFSLLGYKDNKPSVEYEIYRGLEDSEQLGLIRLFDGLTHFLYWTNETESDTGRCNMVNGTDSMIFPPFVDREQSIYAINTDICRSVELRYQYDVDVDGIPAARYSANEWFLDNNEGCFCLNVTQGVIAENGCLLSGAMELYSCVGAMLVLTYPHFLYADVRYRNGVLGMTPTEENHRIFIDIEPMWNPDNEAPQQFLDFLNEEYLDSDDDVIEEVDNEGNDLTTELESLNLTGSPIRGAKRAQFNIFQRSVSGIPATASLRTALIPIVWVEESVDIPDDLKDELRTRLLGSLDLLSIMIPVIIAACCLVLLVGLVMVWRNRPTTSQPPGHVLETASKN